MNATRVNIGQTQLRLSLLRRESRAASCLLPLVLLGNEAMMRMLLYTCLDPTSLQGRMMIQTTKF